ncbi:MAG: HNH endonuclease [Pseudomonas sp.]
MGNQQVRLGKQDLLQVPEMGNYFVDLEGNIYSIARNPTPKILKPYKHLGKSKNPYMRVRLKNKLHMLHRIIASVHLGRQLRRDEVVNHLDGCTTNNQLSNLEVVSQHENVQHAVANNLYCSGEDWHKARGTTKT